MEKVVHYTKIEKEEVKSEGAMGIHVRWLISDKDGAPNFAMRLFEINPKGNSPKHQHAYEHEIFILEGNGKVVINEKEYEISQGYVVFIPPNAKHTIINTGDKPLKFICLIPILK